MNLAAKEIRSNWLRFSLIAIGVGLLLLSEVCVIALYRGIVQDTLKVIDHIGADLWVVEGGTVGPFSEESSVGIRLVDRVRSTPGVAEARGFVLRQRRVPVGNKVVEASLLGLDFPTDQGRWLSLLAGRPIEAGRGEAIADVTLGLRLGDSIVMGRTHLRIVGLVRSFVDSSGNPILVATINDTLEIEASRPPMLVREERPRFGGGATEISAILVRLQSGADPARFRKTAAAWGDVSVLSRQQEEDVFLKGRLNRLRQQILIFSVLICVVTAVVISLILYMATVEKTHEIALLKLIGARRRVVAGLVLQQAALVGTIAYVFAILAGRLLFPVFPRAMVQTRGDLVLFAALIAVICAVGSLLGIRHALSIRAQEVLA